MDLLFVLLVTLAVVAAPAGCMWYAEHEDSRDRRIRRERDECQRAVSKVMDEAPEWRDWFARQLELLDMQYDRHHWITTEWVR